MGVTLSGLASGLDWRSIVDQLTELERVPVNTLQSDKKVNETKISTIGGVRSRMENVTKALDNLGAQGVFFGRKTTLLPRPNSDPNILSALAENRTLTGNYKFEVLQVATQSARQGSAGITNTLAPTSDVSGLTVGTMSTAVGVTGGTFTVNGQAVTFANSESLQDVLGKISTATGGDVTASYDPGTDRITLTSGSNSNIVLGSPTDSSNFLTAVGLFSNGSDTVSSIENLGALNLSNSLANANFASAFGGDGTLTINGVAITYGGADSIRNVIQRINDSDAGVTMSYDAATDSFLVRNKATGSFGVTIEDTAGNLGAVLGLTSTATVTLGENAQFRLNDGSIRISNSNNLTADSHGVQGLTVTANETGTQSITIEGESKVAKERINKFISEYNALVEYADRNTAITFGDDGEIKPGLLADNRELAQALTQLRRALQTNLGSSGGMNRLQDMGIDFVAGKGTLEIRDETKFNNALSKNAAQVDAIFNTTGTGIKAQLSSVVKGYTGKNRILDTQVDSLRKRNRDIDNQIDQMERFIKQREQSMVDAFLQMEQAQQQINSQLQALGRLNTK